MDAKKKDKSSASDNALGRVIGVGARPVDADRMAQEAIAEERITDRPSAKRRSKD